MWLRSKNNHYSRTHACTDIHSCTDTYPCRHAPRTARSDVHAHTYILTHSLTHSLTHTHTQGHANARTHARAHFRVNRSAHPYTQMHDICSVSAIGRTYRPIRTKEQAITHMMIAPGTPCARKPMSESEEREKRLRGTAFIHFPLWASLQISILFLDSHLHLVKMFLHTRSSQAHSLNFHPSDMCLSSLPVCVATLFSFLRLMPVMTKPINFHHAFKRLIFDFI